MADPWMTEAQVAKFKDPRKVPPKGVPVDDVPIGEYEIGCLGTSERVRLDIAVSEPVLYTRYAEALERLANAFRAASQKPLPAPTDGNYQHERLMVILALNRQTMAVRRYLTDLWKKRKNSRGS